MKYQTINKTIPIGIGLSKLLINIKMTTISELYVVTVIWWTGCNGRVVDSCITTTEEKAVKLCLDIIMNNELIHYEYYMERMEESSEENYTLSKDNYIKMLKEKVKTIDDLDDLCIREGGDDYERIWDFEIVKKVIIE